MNKKHPWNDQRKWWFGNISVVALLVFSVCGGFYGREVKAFSETKTGETNSQQTFDFQSKNSGKCALNCYQKNIYSYFFNYLKEQDGLWQDLDTNDINKCDKIKVNFSAKAENFTNLEGKCPNNSGGLSMADNGLFAPFSLNSLLIFSSTKAVDCSGQADCLSQAEENSLGQEKWSKGAQKIPTDFVATAERSLSSANPYANCADGVCSIVASGNFSFSTRAPASSFFGQCRGYGATLSLPETVADQVESRIDLTVKNRPPSVNVSFSKVSIQPNEEAEVSCDVVDPDGCSDKIKEIEWSCVDSNGQSDNCFIQVDNSAVLLKGSVAREILSSNQANPYRAKAIFKTNSPGSFMVTCKAKDDDPVNPLSGLGIGGIRVSVDQGLIEKEQLKEPKNSSSQTESSLSKEIGYCAVLSKEAEICGNQGEIKYEAFYGGNVEPKLFKWSCGNSFPEETSNDPTKTCFYNKIKSYLPSLRIVDKNNQEIECVSQVSGEVIGEKGDCSVEVRKSGSLDNFSSNLTVGKGERIEAKITRRCFEGGQVEWRSGEGSLTGSDSTKAEWQSSEETETSIGALVDKGDQKIDCQEAKITVKKDLPIDNQRQGVFIR